MNARRQICAHAGLRGAAALSVVMYHLKFGANYRLPIEHAIKIIDRSYLFVDLFFVLSGFILCYVYLDNRRAPLTPQETRNFLAARIARIYPLHVLTLFLLLAFHGGLWATHAAGLIKNALPMPGTATAFFANLALVQAWGLSGEASWNIPAWSISAEFGAYVVFPIIVFFLVSRPKIGLTAMLAASMIFYAAIAFTTRSLDVTTGSAMFRGLAGFFLGVGAFAARGLTYKISTAVLSMVQLSTLAAIMLLLQIASNDAPLAPLFVLLVWSTWEDRGQLAKALSAPTATKLGDWSYAIYLLHVPIIHIVGFVYARTAGRIGVLPEPAARVLWIIVIYATTIAAARTIHKKFETPARRILSRALSHHRTQTAS